jgi:hypothetical protein
MQSEDALRAGAVACFTNAQELCEEANLLFEQARFPRSVALALIGVEEFAKAVIFTVAALLPQQRHHLPAKLNGHELKDHICGLADGLVCAYEEGWAIEGTPPSARLGDLFKELARGAYVVCSMRMKPSSTIQNYAASTRSKADFGAIFRQTLKKTSISASENQT